MTESAQDYPTYVVNVTDDSYRLSDFAVIKTPGAALSPDPVEGEGKGSSRELSHSAGERTGTPTPPSPSAKSEAVLFLRAWCEARFDTLPFHKTATRAVDAIIEILAGRCDHEGNALPDGAERVHAQADGERPVLNNESVAAQEGAE